MKELMPDQDRELNVDSVVEVALPDASERSTESQFQGHIVEGFPAPNIKHLGKLIHQYGGFSHVEQQGAHSKAK